VDPYASWFIKAAENSLIADSNLKAKQSGAMRLGRRGRRPGEDMDSSGKEVF